MAYNEWIDIDVLEDYLDGKLDSKTMHLVEKISLEDPFVAEALAGLSQSPKRTHHLSLLQKQLQERVAQKPIVEKRWRITSHRLSIGAAAAVLFVTVSILFWMKENNSREQLSGSKSKDVVAQVAPQPAQKSEAKNDSPVVPQPTVSTIVAKNTVDKKTKPDNNNPVIEKPPVVVEEQAVAATTKVADVPPKVNDNAQVSSATVILGDHNQLAKVQKPTTVALPGKAEGIRTETAFGRAQHNMMINGKVFAKEDGLPLSGAVVRLTGTNKATTTDTKGEFKLTADSSSNQNLSIAYIGYATQQVRANMNQPVNVALEASANRLSEVAISDMADDEKKKSALPPKLDQIGSMSSNATPAGGWERFDAYLKANNKLVNNSGTAKYVTVNFTIRKDGRARNIKVITGLGSAEDQEAIRLIAEGPNWTTTAADRTAKLSIKF